jgi:hypothetical protein
VLRCIKIGFARAEADDILAVRFHLLGFGINRQSQRRTEGGSAAGNLVIHKRREDYERSRGLQVDFWNERGGFAIKSG